MPIAAPIVAMLPIARRGKVELGPVRTRLMRDWPSAVGSGLMKPRTARLLRRADRGDIDAIGVVAAR
jgi:hypothetical protein